MGAVPRKKLTRARKGRRLAGYKLSPMHPSTCSRCRTAKRPHVVCPNCGFYRGRQVVEEIV
ncbi:MAG: 50S ribosomal protein L32 [Chloroflexota bacterium]|nr:MAG: 50S ribosomal protein L32 [SAR202 cluster bacterium]MBT98883.1 50S ribosomal protein L32 [Dehalococcoidia bacterium]MCH2671421.1 50S ribosomal protein L32 [Dehalococcoidia bacterium]MED5207992.1 50S ribosomal protein L32 [Chloroflexota bacterium]MEE3015120.1 50S ribosomal protein L32 [Chloroflexota bacterium]